MNKTKNVKLLLHEEGCLIRVHTHLYQCFFKNKTKQKGQDKDMRKRERMREAQGGEGREEGRKWRGPGANKEEVRTRRREGGGGEKKEDRVGGSTRRGGREENRSRRTKRGGWGQGQETEERIREHCKNSKSYHYLSFVYMMFFNVGFRTVVGKCCFPNQMLRPVLPFLKNKKKKIQLESTHTRNGCVMKINSLLLTYRKNLRDHCQILSFSGCICRKY